LHSSISQSHSAEGGLATSSSPSSDKVNPLLIPIRKSLSTEYASTLQYVDTTHPNDTYNELTPTVLSKLTSLRDQVEQVFTLVGNTFGCYQLLLMAVNRSSDYCKTIHSIPLAPNEEVVNVLETIQNAMFGMT
jgi:hypothetical protein